ncbi:hypothetical protein F4801DRAFT_335593 [Xylaria longipes]|nr:hypothetical protein F4801DRAFT_335593 [Xylaria longipes]
MYTPGTVAAIYVPTSLFFLFKSFGICPHLLHCTLCNPAFVLPSTGCSPPAARRRIAVHDSRVITLPTVLVLPNLPPPYLVCRLLFSSLCKNNKKTIAVVFVGFYPVLALTILVLIPVLLVSCSSRLTVSDPVLWRDPDGLCLSQPQPLPTLSLSIAQFLSARTTHKVPVWVFPPHPAVPRLVQGRIPPPTTQ